MCVSVHVFIQLLGVGAGQRERNKESTSQPRVCAQGRNEPVLSPWAPQFPHASHARSRAYTDCHSKAMKVRIFLYNTAPKCKPTSSFHASLEKQRSVSLLEEI